MKRVLFTSVILLAAGCFTAGCFTSAAANTKKTLKDGTVIESRVSIIGTGDKVSTIAAEGLFADGSEADLGAGFKSANAAQQSTGIGDTLKGVGSLMQGMAGFMAVAQGVKLPAAAAADDVSAESAPAESRPSMSEVTYSTDGYGGAPGPAGEGVYGRPSCGRCRAYHAAHPEASIINLDDPSNRAAFWAALRRLGFNAANAALPVAVTATDYTQAAK